MMYSLVHKLRKPKFHSQASTATPSEDGRADSSSLDTSSVNMVVDDRGLLPSTSATSSSKSFRPPSMIDGRIRLRMPSEQFRDVPRVSRLSVSLLDTLNGCSLDNFLAFMHDLAADHLVTFWIEAENFHVSSGYEADMNSVHSANVDPQGSEAVSIFTKYFSPDSPYYINPTNSVREDVINAICLKDGSQDSRCFRSAKRFVYDLLGKRYFPLYERSKQYATYALAILKDTPVTLSDILYNEQALFYFTEFIERLGCLPLLEFWLTVLNFEHEISSDCAFDKEQIRSDAMIIYQKYISMQASSILSFENELRIVVEDCICKETGSLKMCFEVAFCSVLQCLSEEFLPRFLNSRFYAKFLQDLHNAANNDQDLSLSLACTASDDLNTLEDVPKFSAKVLSTDSLAHTSKFGDSGSSCSVDSASLGSTLKLGIAHLDSMGRYIRDMSDLPKGSGSQRSAFLSEKFRKLLQLNQREEQIWLAEQVAELIVEDIKRMTASASALSDDTPL